MTPKLNWSAGRLPEEVAGLILDLFIEDQRPGGRPTLKPEQAPLARHWLGRTLIDSLARWAHTDELQRLYKGTFRPAGPRRDRPDGKPAPRPDPAFRHHELWDENKVEAVAEQGLGALKDDNEVAELLLNPFALWDVADLIDATQPDTWTKSMVALGRKFLRRKRRLVLRTMGQEAVTAGSGSVRLTFGEEQRALERHLAEVMYGDAERPFALTLYWRPAEGQAEHRVYELEVSPPPRRNDLTLKLSFHGVELEFEVPVPPELKRDPTAAGREKTRSKPSAPVPAGTAELQGEVQGGGEVPPHLILRSFGVDVFAA